MVMLVLDMDLLHFGSNPNTLFLFIMIFYRYDPSNDSLANNVTISISRQSRRNTIFISREGYVLSGDGDNHYPLGTSRILNMIQLLTHGNQLPSPWKLNMGASNFIIGCNVYFYSGTTNGPTHLHILKTFTSIRLGSDCGATDPVTVNFSAIIFKMMEAIVMSLDVQTHIQLISILQPVMITGLVFPWDVLISICSTIIILYQHLRNNRR